ncbi:hypothetical protein SPRG_15526 [Saprolegnia parasitica CBS 223.65]|uniref:CUB domain-containing protein n=1 Tax=Saprolegnia parasitica (strain CBS 223.65) TaxID=695850 RepID=A0A067BLH0_SAPPC|nr:hypothetical protein SPRG_15526 [Saprolegnia parasitica CBS 223.65]KDO19324.1 hypothetical protein SPRG_15526 [Saprolegnia parasitica CBS 223.65]|eukprot:XP_012209967.1 hypothetical protein SPRG_15526 [Saprolegnia parasitica CBS 223.65]
MDETHWVRTSFAALRDETVLLELYSSLQEGSIDEAPAPATATSAHGITMSWDELHQDADVARRLLFASKSPLTDAQAKAKQASRAKTGRGASLVLRESALLGECPEATAKVEAAPAEVPLAHVPVLAPTDAADEAALASKLFSLASCRMQLTIMKALGEHVQKECLRDMVGSILDFPTMALSHVRRHSPEDATLATLYSFALSTLDAKDTMASDAMDEHVLLLLALGVASGQLHFLLPALSTLLLAPPTATPTPICAPLYDRLLHRLSMYEPARVLGAYDGPTLLHHVRLKPDQVPVVVSGASLAVDEASVYLWGPKTGLYKVSTSARDAGTVLCHAEARDILEHFVSPPHIVKAIAGTFRVVTDLLHAPSPSTVGAVVGADDDGRLLLFYTEGDTLVEQELGVDDDLWLPPAGSLLRAIFGTFDDVTETLSDAATATDAFVLTQADHLLLFSVAMPLQDQLRSHLFTRGDMVLPASSKAPTLSLACLEQHVVVAGSLTSMDLLLLSRADLRVQQTVVLPNARAHGDQRLQITTEGDYLYDVILRGAQGLRVITYDLRGGPVHRCHVDLRLDMLPNGTHPMPWTPGSATVYTNGRQLCLVHMTDGILSYAFFSLRDGRLESVQTSAAKTGFVPRVALDATANALWGYHPLRHCIEALPNAGPCVPLRATTAPSPRDLLVAESLPPAMTWALHILGTLEATAWPLLHADAVVDKSVAVVPFAVDVRLDTMQALIRLIDRYGRRFCASDDLAPWEKCVLRASMTVLTANVAHLRPFDDASIVAWVKSSPLASLLAVLTRFPDSDDAIVQAALKLYMASLDIFYVRPTDQLEMALQFLARATKGSLHASERPILALLLQRLAALDKVKDIAEQSGVVAHLTSLLASAHMLFVAPSIDALSTDLVALIYALTQALLYAANAARVAWSTASAAMLAILESCVATTACADAYRHRLEASIVGVVLPLLSTAMHHFLTSLEHDSSVYTSLATPLHVLFANVGGLATAMAATESSTVSQTTTAKVTKTIESPHDYQNNMHTLTDVRVPGATKLTITFDPACRTEPGYDYVTFYTDETQTTYYGLEKYSGRGDEMNWPGVNGRPPLVIDASACVVLFHTDGSGVDWGFKCTIVADVQSPTTCLSLHWLRHIEESIASVLAHIASALIRTTLFAPLSSTEVTHMPLLSSHLWQGGRHVSSADAPVVAFLHALIDPETSSVADAATTALKTHTREDQGAIAHINRAVRAVAAALLHHNLYGMELYQWATTALSSSPSPHVLKIWKTAQKMRQWFDLGDAAESSIHAPLRPNAGLPGLKRQPSAFKGASEDAIVALCAAVVDRATFLLSLTPASFAFVRAAKVRWGLLAKYTTALSRQHSWGHLVREVEAATELKTLLEYRRSSYERSQQMQPKSVTELVLEFVQSDVVVHDMSTILSVRKDRAHLRDLGVHMVGSALAATTSARSQLLFLHALASSLRAMGHEDPCATHVHFFNSLNGCDESQREGLSQSMLTCLKACARILESTLQQPFLSSIDAALLTTLLKAIALDYDARDAYLLYESKVLPHILRLLPSEHVNLRRAAQSMLRVLLSHFVAVDDVPETPRDDVSQFQKQLLAAVRLQLEGVASAVMTASRSSMTALGRHLAGATAPHVPLLRNHSLAFWIYVPSPNVQYALKVGDEVRRGPQWDSTDDEDGGDTGTGSVVGIPGPAMVQVSWHATKKMGMYVWDPVTPSCQVQLLDEGIGGMVFLHGNRNLVADTDDMVPWSHHGLFLTDDAQLKYVLSSGTDKDVLVESNDALHKDAWNHVCIVQENAFLKLFLNGVLDTHHTLDKELILPFNEAPTILETSHPCVGSPDAPTTTWPVVYPGATSLVVSFDPLSQLDRANGDALAVTRGSAVVATYNAGFPGAYGQPPLVVDGDSVVLGLHSTSSSAKWGFRAVVVPLYGDARDASGHVNGHPFYFGEPPPRVLDAPSSQCWLAAFDVINVPLHDHEVQLLMRLNPQEAPPSVFPMDRALHTLGLVKTCAQTSFGRSFVTKPELVRHLLEVILLGPTETRCAALHVLTDLTPTLHPAVVDEQFTAAFPEHPSFLLALLETIGAILAVWQAPPPLVQCAQTLSLRMSAQCAMGLVDAHIQFLRALGASRAWSSALFGHLEASFAWLGSKAMTADDTIAFQRALAAVAVLGGSYDGVVLGSRVRCCVNIDGKESVEAGSIVQFHLRGESRMASVLFDCDNSRPVDVPIGDIACDDGNDESDLFQFASASVPVVVEGLRRFLAQPVSPSHLPTTYLPRRTRVEKTDVIESEHPYPHSTDQTYAVDFATATAVTIVFDAKSRTEMDCDYVQFRARDGSRVYGDDKYSGTHFPGVGALPPLVIPASSFDVLFHSDSNNNDWGFRFTATAMIERDELPPEVPPTPAFGAWCDLRARCLKVLQQYTPSFLSSLPPQLLAEVATIAISPFDGRPMIAMPKSQVFESKHPYANSISEYMAVTFKGASELTITFDGQSRTEDGCDYVVFFKDKTLTERWGCYQYTGRAGTENWPGCGGRPSLVIPAEGFTLLWCTDSSNVDWGWKFVVKATFPSVTPLALTPDALNQRSYHVTEMLYERMRPTPVPVASAFDGFARATAPLPSLQRYLSYIPPTAPLSTPTPTPDARYRVQPFENVAIHTDCNDESDIVDVVTPMTTVHVADARGDWCLVETPSGDRGWCQWRRGTDTVVVGVDDKAVMASDVDESNDEQDELANFTSHFTIEEIKGQSHRLHLLAIETANAQAIQVARATLLSLFQRPDFDLATLGASSGTFLELLVVLLNEPTTSLDAKAALRQRLAEFLALPTAGLAFLTKVVDLYVHTQNQMREALPRGRAIVRTLESSHPYLDNTDAYWKVEIPGATQIQIVFDARSKTEAGCDYVCFYNASDRSIVYGDTQYSGRSGTENWPGVGNRPPLLIDADRFEVYFHSDASGNDWGFAFTAYGLLGPEMPPTPACAPRSDVALWLLEALCAVPQKPTPVLEALYAPSVLDAWSTSLTSMPQSAKVSTLRMLSAVALDAASWRHVATQRTALLKLLDLVKKRMLAQHRAEERSDVKSVYLQSLVQTALALDHAIETRGFPTPASVLPAPVELVCTNVDTLVEVAPDLVWARGRTHHITVLLRLCTAGMTIGVKSTTREPPWSFVWSSSKTVNAQALGVLLQDGDTLTLEADLSRGELSLRKNRALVGSAPVPPDVGDLVPVVAFGSINDAVVVSSEWTPPMRHDPTWYTKLMESKAMLLAETSQRPTAVTLESMHPLPDDVATKTVHLPGATKLEVRFDRHTQMGSQDTLTLTTRSQTVVLTGLDGQLDPDASAFGPMPMTPQLALSPGDVVVRGDDWIYGQEDGGAGATGDVVELCSWKQRAGTGVKVRWRSTNTVALYRYGYNGHYDVYLVTARQSSVLWLDGDNVTLTATPYQASVQKDHEFKGSLDFGQSTVVSLPVTPTLRLRDDFSLQFWLRLSGDLSTKESKRPPQTILVAGGIDDDDNACFHMSATSDLKIRLLFKSGGFLDSMLSEALSPNAWVLLSIVGSGSDVSLYKNGEKWTSHTFYGRTAYATPFHTVFLGSSLAATRPGFKQYNGLHGQLHDVKMWDAPLTPSDVRREFLDKCAVLPSGLPPAPPLCHWTTINKTGRDLCTLKASIAIQRGKVYYEVALLSGGSVLVGWASPQCTPRHKSSVLGDTGDAYAIDLHKQYMWHDGPLPFNAPLETSVKAGDVVGCLLDCDAGTMAFTLNGHRVGDTFGAPTALPQAANKRVAALRVAPILRDPSTPRSMSAREARIAELLAMGCSRHKAIEALQRNDQDVASALEWLLHNPDMVVPLGPHVRLVEEAVPSANRWQDQGGLSPAVALSPLGAQGVAWNLGQRPFQYLPDGYVGVVTGATDNAAPTAPLVVYDWAEDGWEPIQVRHKLLDLSPRLLHRWRLDEGHGTELRDAMTSTTGVLVSTASLRPWKPWLFSPLYQQTLGAWGYKVTIYGHYYAESAPTTRFVCPSSLEYPRFHKHNVQLVEFANAKFLQRQLDVAHGLRVPWSEIAPHDEELVRWPLLCEVAYGRLAAPGASDDNALCANHDRLAARFSYLQQFNIAMHRLLPWVTLEADAPVGSLTDMLGRCRGLLFHKLKKTMWEAALLRTLRPGAAVDLTLNRPKAMRQRATGVPDEDARSALFAQAFRQLNATDNYHFRRHSNVYYVKFLGENAEDAGGPYRETFCQYGAELQSAQLPLLLRTPNAAHNVGTGREKWVLNPTAFGRQHRLRRRLLEFLGKLLGASVRSRDYFALDLAPLVWKYLVHEPVGVDDLEAIDRMLVQSLAKIRTIDELGVTAEMFEDIVLETFTTLSIDNRVVEITPNGRQVAVTFENRCRFADLVEAYRLHEFDAALSQLESGLGKVLPLRYLRLFTARELESMVVGSPDVDVDLLQQCTEYSSCSASDQHIVWFWAVLRRFSHDERSAFLRFVWGRSRLPAAATEFPQWFKLQSFTKTPADNYLPVAHTEELLAKKLLYAIYNCQEIDADGDSVAANQLGWDE